MESKPRSTQLRRRIHNVSSARSRLSNLTSSFNKSRMSDTRTQGTGSRRSNQSRGDSSRYNADQVVGKGTFGTVYKATNK